MRRVGAEQLGLRPEDLARAAVNELCNQPQEDFQQIPN